MLDAVARRRGGDLHGLTADDLFDFDQDHYGGLAAVDVLARRGGVATTSRVLDLGAGLGGPARFLATRRGCQVIGIELNPGRAAGAQRLTERVGLATHVRVVRGDATRLPLRDRTFDVCVSQEAFMHIVDKAAVLAGCRRVLAAGGRLAFTDWVARRTLAEGERRQLQAWMAATAIQTLDGYRALLGEAGFRAIEVEDLWDDWRPILRRRLEMYRGLRADTVRRLGEPRYQEYDQLYAFFVGLVEDGKLAGGRFTGTA